MQRLDRLYLWFADFVKSCSIFETSAETIRTKAEVLGEHYLFRVFQAIIIFKKFMNDTVCYIPEAKTISILYIFVGNNCKYTLHYLLFSPNIFKYSSTLMYFTLSDSLVLPR